MTTQEILQKIREANPELMELSFGCEVAIDASPSPLHLRIIEPYRGRHHSWLMTEHMVWNENVEQAEIIGHTPHLEHLLKVLGSRYAITGKGSIWKYENSEWKIVDIGLCYFMDKSVEQNLNENEALREFISEVLSK